MKKNLITFLLAAGYVSCSLAQNTSLPPGVDGQNKFAVLGNAEMIFSANKDNVQFQDVNFKPIFLWHISDRLFVEAEAEFETGGGSVDIGLEYANMCYFLNKYVIIHAGRFLPKFGAYRGRFGEGFLNRFATNPTGFGDGGIGAMNEEGIGIQGGFGAGNMKFNYDLYVSNGPILLVNPDEAGQFDYESYVGNNKGKAVGGRFGWLPLSNSSLELGYSFQDKRKTGDAGSDYENVGVFMQAVDLNYIHHLTAIQSDLHIIAEWKQQKVGNTTYFKVDNTPFTYTNSPSTFYVAGFLRPAHSGNTFVRNLEIAGRYSEFKTPDGAPWGSGTLHQADVALDYWLKWNSLVKLDYMVKKNEPNTFFAQVVFGF